jgi:hypothetical protein
VPACLPVGRLLASCAEADGCGQIIISDLKFEISEEDKKTARPAPLESNGAAPGRSGNPRPKLRDADRSRET